MTKRYGVIEGAYNSQPYDRHKAVTIDGVSYMEVTHQDGTKDLYKGKEGGGFIHVKHIEKPRLQLCSQCQRLQTHSKSGVCCICSLGIDRMARELEILT